MKKAILLSLFSIILPLQMMAANLASDVYIESAPTSFIKKAGIKFDAKIFDSFNDGNSVWILNPKIFVNARTLPHFSFGSGLRHAVGKAAFGHHIFCNVAQNRDATYWQMGNSLDFFIDKWEITANYYFPKKHKWKELDFFANCEEKIDLEVAYKTPIVKLSFGDEWNVFKKVNTSFFKTEIPFSYFSVGSKVGYNRKDRFSFGVNFCYHFYRSKQESSKTSGIKYNAKPSISYKKPPMDSLSKDLKDFFNNKSSNIDSVVIKDINYKKVDDSDTVIKKTEK